MSMEEMRQFTPATPQTEAERLVALRNDMQVKLALRHNEEFDVFLSKHALDFKQMVEEDTSILETYAKNPEEGLNKAERIYH
jgi:hypothetical protein